MGSSIFRRSMAVVLAFLLLFVNLAEAFAGAASDRFIDVNDFRGKQYESALDFLTEKNILQGKPTGNNLKASINDDVTRSEFVTLIVRASILSEKINTQKNYKDSKLTPDYEQSIIDEKISGKVTSFNDKSLINHWSEKYIKYAEAIGLISGYPNRTFKPNNAITFEEMSEIIAKAITDDAVTLTPDIKEYVTDVNENSWSFASIIKSIKTGIFDIFKSKPAQYGSKHNRLTAFLLVKSFFEKNTYFEEQPTEVPKSIISPTAIPTSIPTSTPIPATTPQNSSSSNSQSYNTPIPTPIVSSVDHLNLSLEIASNNDIKLFWDKTDSLKNFTLSQSRNNKSYENIAEDIKENYYTKVKVENGSLYKFKLVALNTNGKVIASNEVLYALDGNKMLLDSDGDLIPDDIEAKLNLSTSRDDTDNDGLEDFYEVTKTITDPLKNDSDGDGIGDADEDLDNDGLKNSQEFILETNPKLTDTDNDELIDGFEVGTFKSSPLKVDTDEDGLNDGAEYRLGTDPNNSDSDKDGEKDSNETYDQNYKDKESNVAVEITGKGDLIEGISVTQAVYTSEAIKNNAYVSSIYDISVNNAEFEKAKISIPIDKSKVPNGDLKNVAMFFMDEEQNTYVKLENQTVDIEKGIVTGETTHFSKYVLMYVPEWHRQFEAPLNKDDQKIIETYADVVFVIDESNSMENEEVMKEEPVSDPYRLRVSESKAFINRFNIETRVAVIGFYKYFDLKQGLTTDRSKVNSALDSISGRKDATRIYPALDQAIEHLNSYSSEDRMKFIFLITDGQDSDPNLNYDYSQIITKAKENDIQINAFGLGSNVNIQLLNSLANSTGGQYVQLSNASEFSKAFDDVSKVQVKGKDSDEDGIPDNIEINGLRDGMGNIYHSNPGNSDTDDDGILDGEEVGDLVKGQQGEFYIVLSNPEKADTDDDDIDDWEEDTYGTSIWLSDTDGDGLKDGLEIENEFDPLKPNSDGDSFGDSEEYQRKSDPFIYDKNWIEHLSDVATGAILGDFGEFLVEHGIVKSLDTGSIGYCLGQIILFMLPGTSAIASIRDAIADAINGKWGGAFLNLLGAIPNPASVSEKASNVLVKFISKNLYKPAVLIQISFMIYELSPLVFSYLTNPKNLGNVLIVAVSAGAGYKLAKANKEKVLKIFNSCSELKSQLVNTVKDVVKNKIDDLKNWARKVVKKQDGSFDIHVDNDNVVNVKPDEIPAENVNKLDNVSIKEGEASEVNYGEHYTKVDKKKVLKPNSRYTTPEGYTYVTDEFGRIKSCEGTISKFSKGKRNTNAQNRVGKPDRLDTDQGGHLIASEFGGSGNIDNLVAMDSNINMAGGKWRKMEQEWEKALKATPPKSVQVKIEPVYSGSSKRPDKFIVEYKIEGKEPEIVPILNQAGG